MVRSIIVLLCGVAAAESQEDAMSLLQLAASKKHHTEGDKVDTSNPGLSVLPCHMPEKGNRRLDGKNIPDIDSTFKDRDLKICRSWGDTHGTQLFFDRDIRSGGGSPYHFSQFGVSRAAKACDGSWEIQQFLIPCWSEGCQQGTAVKIGAMKFEVYNPNGQKGNVMCYMGSGEGRTECPRSGSHDGVTWSWESGNSGSFCLEYDNQVALTVHRWDWGYQWDQIIHVPKEVCTIKNKKGGMCGDESVMQNGGSCNDDGVKCEPSEGISWIEMPHTEIASKDQLFSADALNILCKRGNFAGRGEGMSLDMCNFPNDIRPKTFAQICEKNNNNLAEVQAVCRPLQEKYPAFYEDCVIDECTKFNKEEEKDIELMAAEINEENTCLIQPCDGADICDAFALSLGEVHSNLGGMGPDSGAEEMRFANVASVNGVATDLVIVANNKYRPKKSENNRVTNGIAAINLDGGKAVSLTFSLVLTGTMEEVTLHTPFRLSFLDVDKGKKGNTEHLAVCGVDNIYMREVSEVETAEGADGCHQVYAGVAGTGADNPTSLDLTEAQKLRSFDISVSKASFTVHLEVKDKRGKQSARNFMFGSGPSVIGHCD